MINIAQAYSLAEKYGMDLSKFELVYDPHGEQNNFGLWPGRNSLKFTPDFLRTHSHNQ